MQKINAGELYDACEKTVDTWDMDTLISYAIDSMHTAALRRPYALISKDGGWFHTSSDSVESATATATDYADCFTDGELEIMEVIA